MSRPIEATPILRGEDAKRLLREMDEPLVISPEKQKDLDRCHRLYLKFMSRKLAPVV